MRQGRFPVSTDPQAGLTHLVLTQGLGIGLIQNDLHDAEHLLGHRCPATVLALLLSYQRLEEETQSLWGNNTATHC